MDKSSKLKKKILFINGHLNVGGCERSLVDVLRHINYKMYDVDLLLIEGTGDYLSEIPDAVHVHYYSVQNSYGPLGKTILKAITNRDSFSLRFRMVLLLSKVLGNNVFKKAGKLFKTLNASYDVIIAYRPGICTDLAAFTFDGKKKISWWHHGEMMFNGKERKQLACSYNKMDKIVAVSESSAKLVKESFPNVSKRVYVIPNMICKDELIKKSDAYQSNVDPRKIEIISVGRFSPEKNMMLCPIVGKILKDRGLDYRWHLIGDGVDEPEIRREIKVYGLERNFVFTGRLMNPYPYYRIASVMVHPSKVESQGITILEAMALGVPVVVVASAGPCEFIESGKNGFLVTNDAEIIADMVSSLVKSEKMKSIFCENAYRTIIDYEPHSIMKKVEKLIEDDDD